jgi:hypothetical protein
MKKFVRPLLITALAAAIVLGAAFFAGSRVRSDYSAPVQMEHITVQRPIAAADDIPLKGVSKLLSLAPGLPVSRSIDRLSQSSTQIARAGTVSLLVSNVDKAVSTVSSLTRDSNGDVLMLDDKGRTEHGGAPWAEMLVRVPEDRFEQTMQILGRIGTERARSINAEDLTGQIVDSSARLRNLRRTEIDIQKIMDRSGSVSQILDAENQLSSVREQIETLAAELKSMRARVAYSTISVSLAAEASTAPSEPAASSQLVSAWNAARHAVAQFTIGLAASIVWLAAFLPYVLLVALCAWLIRRRVLRAPS